MPEQSISPPITFRTRKTRRVTIRVHPDCRIVVTSPPGYPREKLDALLIRKKRWIDKAVAQMREHERNSPRLAPDEIRYRGVIHRFVLDPGGPKAVTVDTEKRVIQSGTDLTNPETLNAWLVKQARTLILAELTRYTALGYQWKRVSIRSQRTRWGSCSGRGTLSFNRLLAATPPFILSYIVAHEVAHTRHLNHSPAFYRELDSIFPGRKEAERWLKANSIHYLSR